MMIGEFSIFDFGFSIGEIYDLRFTMALLHESTESQQGEVL